MSTITKERLEQLANFRGAPVTRQEEQELARIALSSFEAKPVAWLWSHRKHPSEVTLVRWSCQALYAEPPAPVSVPDEVNVLLNHLEDVLPDDAFNRIDVKIWNSVSMLSRPEVYRAAMLQGTEHVTTACKLRDAVEIIRNSGIAIDAEKILAERDALNAPDCWCRTCRPITLRGMRFVVCPDCGNKRCPRANDHRNACTGSNEPGQEGSAYPVAPQQEAQ